MAEAAAKEEAPMAEAAATMEAVAPAAATAGGCCHGLGWLRLLLLLAELLRLELLRLLPLLLRRLERLSLQRLELQGAFAEAARDAEVVGATTESASLTPRWFPHVARRRCWPARRMNTDDGSR